DRRRPLHAGRARRRAERRPGGRVERGGRARGDRRAARLRRGERMIRLVLADDHRMILEGLEQLFRREPDFEVVGTANNGEDAVAAVKRHRPDVLVLDVNMPRGDGMWVVRQLQPLKLPTQVVLLTASLEEEEVVEF